MSKNILLKSNFYKNKTKRDGFASQSISCRIQYRNENREKNKSNNWKIVNDWLTNKNYMKKGNCHKINTRLNDYFIKRKDSDLNFKLTCNLRKRELNAFNAQNVSKTNKTFYFLECSHSFLRLWIESQLYFEVTLENYGKVWCLYHCLPIASFNLLDENDMKDCFNWINLRPVYITEKISKGSKINNRLYLKQKVKANYFMKINAEEGYIKTSIDEIYSSPPKKSFPTNKTVYIHIDEIWSIDLAGFLDYKTSNNKRYKQIFVILDNFRKMFVGYTTWK